MNPLTKKYEDFVKMKKRRPKSPQNFYLISALDSDLLTFFENFPTNSSDNHDEHGSHNHHRSMMFD